MSIIPDDEIKKHGQAAFLELVMKHVRDRDILNLAYELVDLLKIHFLPRDLFRHLLKYIVTMGEAKNYDEFLNVIIDRTKDEYKEETMTIAEQLENRGYQKGMHAGVELGKIAGGLDIAKNMLREGTKIDFVKRVTGLSDDELSKLLKNH